MRERWKGLGRLPLPALCYALALLVWLGRGVYGLAADRGLESRQVAVSAFQLVDLEADGSGYTAVSTDPQMILEDVSGWRVRTLSYRASFSGGDPREMCLYYTTRPGQPYSQDRRVFPTVDADGRYVYTLPRTALAALRLDPCSPDPDRPVTMFVDGDCIDINAAVTLPHGAAVFLPDAYQLFCLALWPGLAAAALDWLRALLRRRGSGAADET